MEKNGKMMLKNWMLLHKLLLKNSQTMLKLLEHGQTMLNLLENGQTMLKLLEHGQIMLNLLENGKTMLLLLLEHSKKMLVNKRMRVKLKFG